MLLRTEEDKKLVGVVPVVVIGPGWNKAQDAHALYCKYCDMNIVDCRACGCKIGGNSLACPNVDRFIQDSLSNLCKLSQTSNQ